MEYTFSVGANAPPEKSSGFLESMTSNLSMIQTSFLDVFSEELDKYSFNTNEVSTGDDNWQPDFFNTNTGVTSSYDTLSSSYTSNYQYENSSYEAPSVTQQQESTSQASSYQNQSSSENTDVTSTVQTNQSDADDTMNNQVNTEIHSTNTNQETEKASETKSEKSSAAQDIATKYEDAQKAALKAAQEAAAQLDGEQQIELMAKVFAMMAPEAAKTTSDVLAKVLEAASEDQIDGEIDLVSMLKESKAGDTLSKLEAFAREILNKEDSVETEIPAETEAHHTDEKFSLFDFVGKKLEKLENEVSEKTTVLTKTMQQELAKAIQGTSEPKSTEAGDQVTTDMTGKLGNTVNIVDGDNQAQQQQKAQVTDTVNTINSAQSKKDAVQNVDQQNMVLVDRSSQTSDITETFGLARSAEARESTPVFQIARNIEVMVKEGKTSMKVQLYPESLGKIELHITSTENGLSVVLTPNQSSTVKLLESQLNQLRNTLAEAGIQLSDLNVSQQNNSQQENTKKKSNQNGGGFYYDELEFESDEPQLIQLDSLSMMDYRV